MGGKAPGLYHSAFESKWSAPFSQCGRPTSSGMSVDALQVSQDSTLDLQGDRATPPDDNSQQFGVPGRLLSPPPPATMM